MNGLRSLAAEQISSQAYLSPSRKCRSRIWFPARPPARSLFRAKSLKPISDALVATSLFRICSAGSSGSRWMIWTCNNKLVSSRYFADIRPAKRDTFGANGALDIGVLDHAHFLGVEVRYTNVSNEVAAVQTLDTFVYRTGLSVGHGMVRVCRLRPPDPCHSRRRAASHSRPRVSGPPGPAHRPPGARS